LKNADRWKPTKFVEKRPGVLIANRDQNEVGVSSRIAADTIAAFYRRAIPEYARGDLLDLGCGTVPLYGLYSRYVDSTTCSDWENSQSTNPHIDMFIDLNEIPLPIDDASFDTVLLSDVLEHVMHPWELIDEVARILRPGGTLLLNVPFYYVIHSPPYDFHRFTEFALRAMCERAGLDVIELSPTGGAAEVIADVTGKVLAIQPWVGKALSTAYTWLAGFWVRGWFGRYLTSTTESTFPIAYALVARRPVSG
jgi:SAM-dependent methyltransferase